MFKSMHLVCCSLLAMSMGSLQADQPGTASENDFFSGFSLESPPPAEVIAEPTPPVAATPSELPLETTEPKVKKSKPKTQFKPFTGKVKGKKVRLRTQPDLDSAVVKELQKGEYLLVVDETDDFWAVEAPSDLKAYVFRSFILDNVVEGNRVNVRLHPSTDAPVISHLNSGDLIQGTPCPSNLDFM